MVTLRSMAISRRILEISQELAIAEQTNDSEALARLVDEQIQLAKMNGNCKQRPARLSPETFSP